MKASAIPVRVAIDIETTGLQVETESIIEIGAVKFRGSEIIDTFETMIDPRRPLPYRIQRLTKIAPAMLVGAPQFAAIAPQLRTFLGDLPLVGHSVGFDAGFLRKMRIAERNPLIDTFELASLLLPTLSSYSLESVAAFLQLPASIHHRALADADLSRDVLLTLETRIADLPDPVLNALCGLATPTTIPAIALLQREQRARGSTPTQFGGATSGALGAALNAKLHVDPAVLGMRVAALGPAAPLTIIPIVSDVLPPASDDDAMRACVTDALNAREAAIVELAPDDATSALTPALAWAQSTGKHLVIAVASMAGVRKLMRTAIPTILGQQLTADEQPPLTVSTLFEAHDYVCLHRWYGPGRAAASLPTDAVRGLAKLTIWLNETETGTRDEVTLNPMESQAWDAVRAGQQFVELPNCAYRERGWCFARRARDAAAAARIIITTHAALLSDGAKGTRSAVPAADGYLILDAHLLEERAITHLTTTLDATTLTDGLTLLWQRGAHESQGLVARAIAAVPGGANQPWGNQIARAQDTLPLFFSALGALLADAQAGGGASGNESVTSALRLDEGARSQPAWGTVADAWQSFAKRLTVSADAVTQAARSLTSLRGYEELSLELTARGEWLRDQVRWGNEVITQPHPDVVYWTRPPQAFTKFGPRGRNNGDLDDAPTLQSAPAHISQILGESLLRRDEGVILAGTALSVDGHFDYISERLGVPQGARAASVNRDRSRQSLVLIPSDAPEPNLPAYQRVLNETLITVARTLGGRTVALFASHTAMRTAYNAIKSALESQKIMVLAQGIDGSQRQLWQNYRTQERVVLLGAGSFWEGAESENARPACIFIARLPLAAMSDPLLAARSEGYADPMHGFIVPHAVLRVRNALNRLAWEDDHRSVIMLYDRRVVVKEYGATFLNSLPPTTQREESVTRLGEIAQEWLDSPTRRP